MLVIAVISIIYFSDTIFSNLDMFSQNSPHEKNLTRIAVLPFDNFSPDEKDIYIADGFTEEIITVLAKIKNLHVIARTSVMKYRNEKKNIA